MNNEKAKQEISQYSRKCVECNGRLESKGLEEVLEGSNVLNAIKIINLLNLGKVTFLLNPIQ